MATGNTRATPVIDATGVPNLDWVLGGGLQRGSLAIVVGPPGSGKTTLAAQIVFSAARSGRRALILTALSEPTSKLVAHLRTFRFFDGDTARRPGAGDQPGAVPAEGAGHHR